MNSRFLKAVWAASLQRVRTPAPWPPSRADGVSDAPRRDLELTAPQPGPYMVSVLPEAVKTDTDDSGVKSHSGIPLAFFKERSVAIGTLLNILQRARERRTDRQDRTEGRFGMNENGMA